MNDPDHLSRWLGFFAIETTKACGVVKVPKMAQVAI